VKIIFHRSKNIEVKIQKPETLRAFAFEVQAGFGRATEPQVDPDSGMLINLVIVDEMLVALAGEWALHQWTSLTELLTASEKFLSERASSQGVVLEELCLKEIRGFWLGSKKGSYYMGQEEILEENGHLNRVISEEPLDEEKGTRVLFRVKPRYN